MTNLNFPFYEFRIRDHSNTSEIFDDLRGKYVALTPEEWVRQHIIQYLICEKGFPKSLIAVEIPVMIKSMQQRVDVLVYHTDRKPLLLVECKAPEVHINQKVFDQIAVYNLELQVPYLIVTNGMKHFCCQVNKVEKKYDFLKSIPAYNDIKPRD